MIDLAEARILLIAPFFFGYEKEIIKELELVGAHVDFLPDRPFNSSLMKAVTRLKRSLVLDHADRFFKSAIAGFGRSSYTHVLVVQGEGVSPRLLQDLRSAYPEAKFGLYMWDSFRNKRSLTQNLPHFDYCLSFDPHDAKQYGMRFRPLFFSRGFEQAPNTSFAHDISFIGTAHSDRYKIVQQMAQALPKSAKAYWYLFLQAPWMFWAHKLGNPAFKGAKPQDFNYLPLSKQQVQGVFFDSRTILDIEHPAQTGLTMRTFETLGASKKLVTTNAQVRDYDFFDPSNILVIDRKSPPRVPDSFLETAYVPARADIYAKYSLQGWIKDVTDN